MSYAVELSKKADKDLQKLPAQVQQRVAKGLKLLRDDLQGDVKRLTNFTPEYRLRVGNYRVLFEIEDNTVVVQRILHRKDAY